MSEQETIVDTFNTPVEPVAESPGVKIPEGAKNQVVEDISLDTFDTPMEIEEKKEEKKPETKKADDSQTSQLEDNEDEEKEEEKPEGKEEVEAAAEEKPAEETTTEKVKVIKGSSEQGGVQVPDDTEFRTKISGKSVSVPLKELLSNYSGKVAYDQKFSEHDTKVKEFDGREEKFLYERGQVLERLGNVMEMIDDPNKTPDEAVGYLLDLAGRNSYDFKKKFFESKAEEFEAYADMDEVERKLYWAEQKAEYLERSSKSSANQQRERQTREDTLRQVDQLRETYGISEEQYVEAHQDLVEMGEGQQPSYQQVVEYAAVLPLIAKAEEMVKPFESKLDEGEESYEAVVQGIAEALKANVSEQAVIEELTRIYGNSGSEEVNELNKKVWDTSLPNSSKTKQKKAPYEREDSEKGLEFFSDIDPY